MKKLTSATALRGHWPCFLRFPPPPQNLWLGVPPRIALKRAERSRSSKPMFIICFLHNNTLSQYITSLQITIVQTTAQLALSSQVMNNTALAKASLLPRVSSVVSTCGRYASSKINAICNMSIDHGRQIGLKGSFKPFWSLFIIRKVDLGLAYSVCIKLYCIVYARMWAVSYVLCHMFFCVDPFCIIQ